MEKRAYKGPKWDKGACEEKKRVKSKIKVIDPQKKILLRNYKKVSWANENLILVF